MKDSPVITIDGPSGSGKSTIAKMLAQKLGYEYIDTGAMYRGVAYAYKLGLILREHESRRRTGRKENAPDLPVAETSLQEELSQLLERLDIRFEFNKETRVLLEGKDISKEIRDPEISILASTLSRQKIVREYLYRMQREIGRNGGVVLEGRDTGSVVFPDAEVKIYLDADADERARRRYLELASKGNTDALAKVKEEMITRDVSDSQRDIAPLVMPEHATYIDTTGLTILEVLNEILKHVPQEGAG